MGKTKLIAALRLFGITRSRSMEFWNNGYHEFEIISFLNKQVFKKEIFNKSRIQHHK